MEEMETVLYSITLGQQIETSNGGKARYQAFSAAISSQNNVDLVLAYLHQQRKLSSAKTCVLAYRVNTSEPEEGAEPNDNKDL